MKFWQRWLHWYESSESPVARWIRAGRDALLGEMPALAGGTALFAIFAVVPTLAAAVAIYSVVSDPAEIQRQLRGLGTVLPPNVIGFISDQLERQTQRSSRDLGFALVVSIFAAVFSARGAARAMVDALNRAYRVRERREWLAKTLVTIAMAAGTLVGLMLMLAVVVALPAVVALVGLEDYGLVRWTRWPALMTVMFASLVALYRFGPSPRTIATRHLWPGALIGTVLLMLVSWALSEWVERVMDYNVWYGAFGTTIVVMLWFYLSTIAIVIGGFVNAELERHAGAPEPDRSMY